MQDWSASKTNEEQGSDLRELAIKGKLQRLSFTVQPTSAFWRAGFKLVDPNGSFIPLNSPDSILFHLGSTESKQQYGLTAYRDGKWLDILNKTKTHNGKPIKVLLEITDKNFLKVYINGSLEFKPDWHLSKPSMREKVALIAWGDNHSYGVKFKDIDVVDEGKRMKVFFSWQADISKNQGYILKCLRAAAKEVGGFEVETAIRNKKGAVDIAVSILQKIDESDIFVADVSFINPQSRKIRKTPNPNVLYELGYAVRAKGHEPIVLIANTTDKESKSWPFDIRNRNIMLRDFTAANRKFITQEFVKILSSHDRLSPPSVLSKPYVYITGSSHMRWADGETITLNLRNDESEAYYLESVELGGKTGQVGRNVDPGSTTANIPVSGLPFPPFDNKYESISLVLSRLDKRYRITQKLNLSGRADDKFNFDGFDPRPSSIELIS